MRPVFSLLLSTDFSSYCQFYLWNVDAILFQAELPKFCWSGGRLYAHKIVVAFNYQLSVIRPSLGNFDFKQLLDTGTILWIEVWILFSFRAEAVSLEPNSVDGAQEAEETNGPGKWENSTEHSHGLN